MRPEFTTWVCGLECKFPHFLDSKIQEIKVKIASNMYIIKSGYSRGWSTFFRHLTSEPLVIEQRQRHILLEKCSHFHLCFLINDSEVMHRTKVINLLSSQSRFYGKCFIYFIFLINNIKTISKINGRNSIKLGNAMPMKRPRPPPMLLRKVNESVLGIWVILRILISLKEKLNSVQP